MLLFFHHDHNVDIARANIETTSPTADSSSGIGLMPFAVSIALTNNTAVIISLVMACARPFIFFLLISYAFPLRLYAFLQVIDSMVRHLLSFLVQIHAVLEVVYPLYDLVVFFDGFR